MILYPQFSPLYDYIGLEDWDGYFTELRLRPILGDHRLDLKILIIVVNVMFSGR